VDGRRVDISSYAVRAGQEVRIRPGSPIEELAREALELTATTPEWLKLDRETLTGRVVALPAYADVQAPFDPTAIIEFYSR